MRQLTKIGLSCSTLLIGMVLAAPASAQTPAPPAGGGGAAGGAGGQGAAGGRGNRGGNAEQFRQRAQQRMKEAMGLTDEEFTAIQPKIDKVQQAQRAMSAGRGMGGGQGGPGGGGGGRGNRGGAGGAAAATPTPAADAAPTTPVAEKSKDLQGTLDNKEAKPEEIKAKLTALREARAKAKGDLTKAQDELREVLTVRQESYLVMMGILE
jgi:hypothetical protein